MPSKPKDNATNSGWLDIRRVPIESVLPWDKNPRGIKTKDFERLKKQILRLGVYKPLIAYQDGDTFIVLGGNMRIRALKDLGLKEVEISVVNPISETQKIEFALSDNDRAGFYQEQELAELIFPHIQELNLDDFKVDMGEALDLKSVIEGIGPKLPDPSAQQPPTLDTEQFIEIYCSKANLKDMQSTLDEWGQWDGITINIS
jgi:hypothetical protein